MPSVLNKSPKQLDTLGPARQKQAVWRSLAHFLRNEVEQFLDQDETSMKQVFIGQMNTARSVGYKKQSALYYMILGYYKR